MNANNAIIAFHYYKRMFADNIATRRWMPPIPPFRVSPREMFSLPIQYALTSTEPLTAIRFSEDVSFDRHCVNHTTVDLSTAFSGYAISFDFASRVGR
jgi:hypothetical protein